MAINRDSVMNGFTTTMTGLGVITLTVLTGLGIGILTGKVKIGISVVRKIKEEQSGQSE